MSETFQNLFGGHADDYARFRPESPLELGALVAKYAPDTERVLDCGTGNGQAARMLAEFFQRVDAVDASAEQIHHAKSHPRVHYAVSQAELLPYSESVMSAVVCATALHWFDREQFASQVRRVLKPGGVFVAWTYARAGTEPAIESLVTTLAREMIGDYWDPRVVEQLSNYDAPLDLTPIEVPSLAIKKRLSFDEFVGYLRTWSAFQAYVRERSADPMSELYEPLRDAWGEGKREVVWDLHVTAGRA
jgi:SAM-dependent methyltransferase